MSKDKRKDRRDRRDRRDRLHKKVMLYSIIAESVLLVLGTVVAWIGDKNIRTFDSGTFRIVIVLCILLFFGIITVIYPTVMDLCDKSDNL